MKIKINPGTTPDRIRLICLHIQDGINTYEKLKEHIIPNIFKSDSLNDNIQAALELKLIKIDKDIYKLKITKNHLENIKVFKYIISKALIEDNTYMSYLQSILASEISLKGSLSDISDFLRSNNPQIDESVNYLRGFRFWFQYLGYGFYSEGSDKRFYVSLYNRLKILIDNDLFEGRILYSKFIELIIKESPEISVLINNKKFDNKLTLALKNLEYNNIIKSLSQKDAYDFVIFDEFGIENRYSDIERVI